MKKKWIGSLISIAFLVILIGFAVPFLKEDDRPKVLFFLKSQIANIGEFLNQELNEHLRVLM